MAVKHLWLTLVIFFSLAFIAHCDDDEYTCLYNIYVRTGSIFKAGTDSIITLTLYDEKGNGIRITNLEAWGGMMGPNYNYFERGNLDIFSGRGPCLSTPLCAINVTSDGSGAHHGWYVNYFEVTTTGPHAGCAQKRFDLEQWLALDAAPYELTAIRNYCPYDITQVGEKAGAIKRVPILKSGIKSVASD